MSNTFPTFVDVSNKGQILIPVNLRRLSGIRNKGKVLVYPTKNKKLIVEPVADDPIKAACGFLADKDNRSWSSELIEERKKDLSKEEKI